MKTKLHNPNFIASLFLLATINYPLSTALAQGTAFTYQGQLNKGSAPANGHYDFIFQVFDAANSGNGLGGALTTNSIGVQRLPEILGVLVFGSLR